jgi:hypothetical protein
VIVGACGAVITRRGGGPRSTPWHGSRPRRRAAGRPDNRRFRLR